MTARCCAGKRSKGFAGWKLLCVLGRPQGRLFFAALPAWRHRSRAPISAGRRLASIAYTRLASRLGQVLPWIKAVWTDTQNQREIPVSQPDIGLPLQCLPLESAGALFERVDKALYTANGCGRDCTIVDEGVARVAQVVLATWQARPASFAGRCSITRAICSCCCLKAGERDDFSINDCIDVAFYMPIAALRGGLTSDFAK